MELLPLVCLCLLSCSGDGSVVVTVEEGSDAMLPCSINTKENIEKLTFDWKKGRQEVFFYQSGKHYNNGGRTGQDKQFEGRVFHFEDELKHGNASIKITRTQLTDSGNYACTFPPDRNPSSVTLHVAPDPERSVLKDRTGENIPGAAPKPSITTLNETNHWRLLQCEAHGDPLPTVEWKDSDNNTLPADTPQISDRGGRSYITVNTTVTKTGSYSCVAMQEKFSHQIAAVTYVLMYGAASETVIHYGLSAGAIAGFVVLSLLLVVAIVGGVGGGLYIKHLKKENREKYEEKREPQTEPDSSTSLKESS